MSRLSPFDRSKTRDEVFSIDTPPLTASGSLHAGHVFSFTHTDTVARYQRMRGREVFGSPSPGGTSSNCACG